MTDYPPIVGDWRIDRPYDEDRRRWAQVRRRPGRFGRWVDQATTEAPEWVPSFDGRSICRPDADECRPRQTSSGGLSDVSAATRALSSSCASTFGDGQAAVAAYRCSLSAVASCHAAT
jgi:hypothetical protein